MTGAQKVLDVVDGYVDVGKLGVDGHAFQHAAIHGVEISHPRVVGAIFRVFHHGIIAKLVSALQKILHLQDISSAFSSR